ncbi:MAG: ribonuclease III [Lachnospiraceae bacterium]|nr:ribonuclease III [Lachnospiraceae bacterium]
MEESVRLHGSMLEQIKQVFGCGEADVRAYSPLALAYIGDAVYDLVIRTVVVERANRSSNELHKRAIRYVNAKAQAQIIEELLEELTEDELAVYKRGRNAKSYTIPRNASPADYRKATGMEALLGYLYLQDKLERVLYLIRTGLQKAELEL